MNKWILHLKRFGPVHELVERGEKRKKKKKNVDKKIF